MNLEASEYQTFVEDDDHQDWIPLSDGIDFLPDMQSGQEKNFCKQKYADRIKSRNIAFQKLPPKDQKKILAAKRLKAAENNLKESRKLSPHVFEEAFGFVGDRVHQLSNAKREADMALQVARQINDVKETIKYKGTSHEDLRENSIARLEDLVAFIAGIATSGSVLNFLSLLHLYLRTFFPEPMTLKIIEHVRSTFDIAKELITERAGVYGWTSQSGEDVDQVEEKFGLMKNMISNWKMHRHCDLARHVCNTVNILVTFGFFPDLAENPLELNGYQLFQAKAWDVQKNSLDFTEMVLETAVFFLDRGYAAFKTGDLTLLMYDDAEAMQLEREYALLVSALPLLETGNLAGLERFHESIKDQSSYEIRLEKLIAKFSGMLKTEKSPYVKNTLTNKYVVLSKVRTQLILCQKSSCIREKPFGVLIHGGSAVGKSMVNSILLKVLLTACGYESGKDNVVTLNDADKFQSEYRTHHTAVTMDDFGNTKAEHYDACPTTKIIDFLNNVPKAALNPNAELKGNVMIQPKIVTVTTNVKTVLAGAFSNEPVSILRRFNVVLDVFLRPEWTDPDTGGPNESMMAGKFCPDAWSINVERVGIVRRPGADTYEFNTIKEGASIFEALDIMKAMAIDHFKSQKTFVRIVEEMYTLQLCEHFFPPTECPHCLSQQCLFEPLGEFDTADPLLLARVRASVIRAPSKVEKLKEIVADWYVERKLTGAVKHISGSCSTIMEALEKHKSVILKATLASVAIGATIFAVHRIYKAMNKLREQGSVVETPVRIEGDASSPWKRPMISSIPKTQASSTTTFSDLCEKVAKNIAHVYVIDKERQTRRKCDIMPMCNNFWLAPSHVFEEKEYLLEIQTTARDVLGKNPTQLVGPELWARIPDTDFILICLTSGGDVPDFGRFLPTEAYEYPDTYVEGIWKNSEGEVDRDGFKLHGSKQIESKKAKFYGVTYNFPRQTFEGLCMMALVTRTRGPVIAGFHLAGKTGESFGAAGTLLKSQLDKAVAVLRGKSVLECHSTGDMLTSKYGIDFTPKSCTPPSSAVNFLANADDGTQPIGIVFGEHPMGTRTFQSGVKKSPISDSVTKHTGIPRMHGKPTAMNSWVHWQRDLSLMSVPRGKFRPSIMLRARNDFAGMVDRFFDANPAMLELIHPYSKDSVLAGIDGVNSVDRVDLGTSMGFPVNKQKKNYIHESDRKVPGISCPLDVDEQFWDEVERMEECLANGERVHTIFRANLKDEPTKFTKKKVRVFAGCEFAFLCLTRKYYLSIIRVIQSNWADFECAVGINAHGKDWSKLAGRVSRYGTERMIAGDYAAYDKTASPEALLASFDQLIRMAEKAGYTDRQLRIMRGIASEICYPVYEFNGVLIQMLGSMPSGHSLTVLINNIENSLDLRYVYHSIHEAEEEDDVPPFDSVVALVCYGDDNIMGVDEGEKEFNHTRIVDELAKVGVTYTMADKEADSIPYIDFSEISFLKRSFVWSDDVGEYVAPIEEASIAKSLHNYIKRKGSDTLPEKIAADAIKNAQREYFRHGREVYTLRMAQLAKVRDECDLTAYVGDILSYDEAVAQYLEAAAKGKKTMYEEPDTICFD